MLYNIFPSKAFGKSGTLGYTLKRRKVSNQKKVLPDPQEFTASV
jgi:hypothetical protein